MNNKKWILGKRDGQKPKKSSFHKMAIKHLEWILGDIAIILGLCLLKNQDGENKNNTVALLCQSYLKTYYLSIEADTILRLMSDPDVPIPKKDLGTIIKGLKNFIPLLNYYKKKRNGFV